MMNMKNMKNIGRSLVCALLCAAALPCRADRVDLRALVLDETTRTPLVGVKLEARFYRLNGFGIWKGEAAPEVQKVQPDRDGRCRAVGRTNAGEVEWIVEDVPSGYYKPRFVPQVPFTGKDIFGRWQPSGIVTTVLVARVGRPVPLALKAVGKDIAWSPARHDDFAAGRGRVAYDFVRGDWLPPEGRGEVADVVFTRGPVERTGKRGWRATAEMRFQGEGNGIVAMKTAPGSVPLIRAAPEEGYAPMLAFEKRKPEEGELKEVAPAGDYCFRIRTRRDAQGRLVGGCYGKIYGGIRIEGANSPASPDGYMPMGQVRLQYYLNPKPLDRNLEWNQEELLEWNAAAGQLVSVEADCRALYWREIRNPQP